MAITVRDLCEQAVGLLRGKRLILNGDELLLLNDLNYEGLANIHAQDEAVVCAMHFERVRDRLLQIYPWTFARRSQSLGQFNREIPDTCLTVLCVLKDGAPIDYNAIALDGDIPEDADEIIYTMQVEDVKKWPPIFCDVFIYSLAVEICPAVTGKPEYSQLLEQKAQELIHRAHQIGAIRAETRLTLQEELYNRAIGLSRGQRSLKTTSAGAVEQGADNAGFVNDRMTAEYQACVRAADRVRDRLLELYAWRFARKSGVLSSSTAAVSGWNYAYNVPADCMRVLAVVSGDEPVDYEEAGGVVYCNAANPTVRYTGLVEDVQSWPGIFADVYCYNLAQEIIMSTTANPETIQLLEAKAQSLIREAHQLGEIRAEVKIPAGEEIYNRAIALARGQRTLSPSGNAAAEQGVDITGDVNYREREALAVCRRSLPAVRDRLLQLYPWVFARKNAELLATETISGWSNGYSLPSDCMNVLTVLAGNEPVDYEVVNGYVYCNSAGASVRYTAKVEEVSTWPGVFVDAVCYELAEEIVSALTGNNESIAVLEQKKQAAIVEAYKVGTIKTETRIPAKYELFNRAIGLVKGLKTEQADMLDTRYEDELSACRRSYENVRNRLLQSYAWVFARKTEIPAQLSENVPGWRYTYMLPVDCLRVIAVIGQDRRADWDGELTCRNISDFSDKVELTDYETAGRELYANRDVVYVRYTAKVDDSSEWEAVFTEAFVIMLAIEVALNVVGDKNIIAILEQRLARLIEDAKLSGAIREETKLPKQRESIRAGAVNRQFLDYSGIPTLPCDKYYGRRVCYEGGTGELCGWRD